MIRVNLYQLKYIGEKCLVRDDAWKELTVRNTSEQQFLQEFECSFLGSINTLISPTKIQTIPYADPIESNAGFDVHENHKRMLCIVYV